MMHVIVDRYKGWLELLNHIGIIPERHATSSDCS